MILRGAAGVDIRVRHVVLTVGGGSDFGRHLSEEEQIGHIRQRRIGGDFDQLIGARLGELRRTISVGIKDRISIAAFGVGGVHGMLDGLVVHREQRIGILVATPICDRRRLHLVPVVVDSERHGMRNTRVRERAAVHRRTACARSGTRAIRGHG